MAHIKRLVSTNTGKVSFRAVVRIDGKQLTRTRKKSLMSLNGQESWKAILI